MGVSCIAVDDEAKGACGKAGSNDDTAATARVAAEAVAVPEDVEGVAASSCS